MNVQVTIDRLVLDGVAVCAAHRPALASSVEAELARLIQVGGLPTAWANGPMPAISGAGFALPPDGNPVLLGQRIAQAVYAEDAP